MKRIPIGMLLKSRAAAWILVPGGWGRERGGGRMRERDEREREQRRKLEREREGEGGRERDVKLRKPATAKLCARFLRALRARTG